MSAKTRPTHAVCCRCKQVKPMTQLNGYNPISKDASRTYCIRLAECNSAAAQRQIQHLAAIFTGAKTLRPTV